MRRVRQSSTLRTGGSGIGDSREFLERLAHILVQTGHSPKKLVREFREICSRLSEPIHAWDPACLNYLVGLAHVMERWHTDPEFVDSKGKPIALPLRSRGLSLTSLITRAVPGEDPKAVVDSLIRVRGVRRRGRLYLPTGRLLRLTRQNAWAHGLMALLRILRTIDYNVSQAPERNTILERVAVNPRFPVRALPAFHRWLKGFAAKFLWDADDKMRRREARSKSEPTTGLGVAVYAFEDPVVTGTRAVGTGRLQRTSRLVRRRQRTGGHRARGKR